MGALGLEALLTLLLPGALLAGCGVLLLLRFAPSVLKAVPVDNVLQREWLAAVVVLLASALFGSLIHALAVFIEEKLLDKHSAKYLHVTDEEYGADWETFVAHGDWQNIPFIRRLAFLYFTQSRIALAGYLCTIAAALLATSREMWLVVLIASILFILLGMAAVSSHVGLSEYRQVLIRELEENEDLEEDAAIADDENLEPAATLRLTISTARPTQRALPWHWAAILLLGWLAVSHFAPPASASTTEPPAQQAAFCPTPATEQVWTATKTVELTTVGDRHSVAVRQESVSHR